MSSFDKKKARWKRIKSKGKKRYVLKTLLIFDVLLIFMTLLYLFVIDRTKLTDITSDIFGYLLAIIILSPVGVWVGKNSWEANIRRFEK